MTSNLLFACFEAGRQDSLKPPVLLLLVGETTIHLAVIFVEGTAPLATPLFPQNKEIFLLPPAKKKANLKDDDNYDSEYKSDRSNYDEDNKELLTANANVAALLLKVSRLESANAALRSQQNIRDGAIVGFHANHIGTELHAR